MAKFEEEPRIGRVKVWVDCSCGEEMEFEDVGSGTMESMPCEECGRRVEISMDGFAQHPSPGHAKESL